MTLNRFLLAGHLSLVGLVHYARAAVPSIPHETPGGAFPSKGISPLPTNLPLNPAELFKRQEDSLTTSTDIYAPDRTCGYVSGSPGAHLACDMGATCLFLLVEGGPGGRVCCEGEDTCSASLECYDRTAATNLETCDEACQTNRLVLKCTDRDEPFCRTYAYPSRVVDYECGSTRPPDVISVLFTYDGQSARTMTTVHLENGITIAVFPTTETTVTTSPPIPTPPSGSETPVGVIVGGVIGGIALVGFIVLGAIVFLRKGSRKPETHMQQPIVTSHAHPPAGGMLADRSTVVSSLSGTTAPTSPVDWGQGFQPMYNPGTTQYGWCQDATKDHNQPSPGLHEIGTDAQELRVGGLHELSPYR